MARQKTVFTIYDVMEANGEFEKNTANVVARDPVTGISTYAGPVEYPKMLYHPTGEERVVVPAEIIVTPLGPQRVGEQRILVTKTVRNAEEEKELLEAGWHDRPNKAVAMAKGEPMPLSKDDEIRQLKLELAAARADQVPVAAVTIQPRVRMGSAAAPTVE